MLWRFCQMITSARTANNVVNGECMVNRERILSGFARNISRMRFVWISLSRLMLSF
jgi:hypothetical protein